MHVDGRSVSIYWLSGIANSFYLDFRGYFLKYLKVESNRGAVKLPVQLKGFSVQINDTFLVI